MLKNRSLIAVALGIVGAGLHRWQLSTCFDALGLPVAGIATPCLMALYLLSAVLLIVLLRSDSAPLTWNGETFSLPLLLSAVCAVSGGVAYVLGSNGVQPSSVTFQYTMYLLPLLLGGGVLAMAVGLFLLSRKGALNGFAPMLVGFGCCFWLINAYRDHASDPVILHFAPLIIAVAFACVAWYQFSALAVNKQKPRLILFFLLMGIVLNLTAVANTQPLYCVLLCIAQALAFVGVSERVH